MALKEHGQDLSLKPRSKIMHHNNRVCFDATDIDRFVVTMTQAEILNEIRLAATALSENLSDVMRFYWLDRSDAFKLALFISEWYGTKLIMYSEVLTLKIQNSLLTQKLYKRVTTKINVRGGIPL